MPPLRCLASVSNSDTNYDDAISHVQCKCAEQLALHAIGDSQLIANILRVVLFVGSTPSTSGDTFGHAICILRVCTFAEDETDDAHVAALKINNSPHNMKAAETAMNLNKPTSLASASLPASQYSRSKIRRRKRVIDDDDDSDWSQTDGEHSGNLGSAVAQAQKRKGSAAKQRKSCPSVSQMDAILACSGVAESLLTLPTANSSGRKEGNETLAGDRLRALEAELFRVPHFGVNMEMQLRESVECRGAALLSALDYFDALLLQGLLPPAAYVLRRGRFRGKLPRAHWSALLKALWLTQRCVSPQHGSERRSFNGCALSLMKRLKSKLTSVLNSFLSPTGRASRAWRASTEVSGAAGLALLDGEDTDFTCSTDWTLFAQCALVMRATQSWIVAERHKGGRTSLSAAKLRMLTFKLDSLHVIMARTLESVPGGKIAAVQAAQRHASATSHAMPTSAQGRTRLQLGKRASQRLRSRNTYIDEHLGAEDGTDDYADLEDFIVE